MSEINKMLNRTEPNNRACSYHYVIWHAKKQKKRGRNISAHFITESGEVIRNPQKALKLAQLAKNRAGIRRSVSNSYFNERMQRASRGHDIYVF